MVAITAPTTFGTLPVIAARRHRTAACYRRRRLAVAGVLALVLALCLAVGELLAARSSSPASPALGAPVARVTVVVRPGDTVWSVAAELADGGDPRPIVDAIVEANGGATLVAGQRLEISDVG